MINGQSPPPEQLRHNYDNNPLHENRTSPSSPYNRGTPSLVSAPPIDDLPRSRYSGIESSSRSTIGLPQSRFSRTGPDISPRSRAIYPDRRSSLQEHRPYRHSTLSTIRSSRHPAEIAERTLYDGTESTISTTAPSTVWDDLEEMKSRIRKLELTGKLPPSREAMHSTTGERPRTAATTATSLSSSPKLLSSPNRTRRVSNTVEEPEASTAIGQVHPLLQSSLSKAKNVVSRNVYNALEITVSNSVKLSTMLGSGNPPGSVSTVNGSGSSDRLARRKADLICRSLTELCLAMTEEQLNKQPSPSHKGNSDEQQRNGTDGDVTPISPYQRDGSQEPDGIVHRRSSTRVSSNLEAQRSNLANTINNWQHQVQADFNQTSSPSSEVPAGRLNRLSTSSRTRRLQLGDEHEDGASPHTSSLSRAMTDINPATSSQRGPPRQRVSHDYRASYSTVRSPQTQSSAYQSLASTSHPHPTPRTPSLPQSGLPFHRSYITPSSNTPSTFRSSIQAGSSRYGFTPSPSDRSPALNVPRLSQPEPSQTKIVAPSSKLATSYTPISQNRPRTNSLDTRRFPTRQRAVSTVNDPVHIDGS